MSSESTFWLVHELQTAFDAFATAGSVDPLSALLVLLGGLLTGAASLGLGVLALGAILDAIGDALSHSPPSAPHE